MKINYSPLRSKDISFLNQSNCAYSVDFRAIGEGMDYQIPAMFKYENLSAWITTPDHASSRYIIVNDSLQMAPLENPPDARVTITAKRHIQQSQKSLYERIENIPNDVHRLWVGVPHPEADAIAQANQLDINYSYSDFLRRNDKISQKELLGDLTPEWRCVTSIHNLEDMISQTSEAFLKRRHGSGGYTIFDLSIKQKGDDLMRLIAESKPNDWYVEQKVSGTPYSVQGVAYENGEVTIFGFSEQIIDGGKHYEGARILPLSHIEESMRLQINRVLQKAKPLLAGYEGFFGVDFMHNNESFNALELNVRLTAAAVPTLIANGLGESVEALYREDVSDTSNSDIVVVRDDLANNADCIEFQPMQQTSVLGYNDYIKLKDCQNLPHELNDEIALEIERIVSENVSQCVASTYYNFWPFGWTIVFVLSESHCAMSSWHKEKTILIDTFCCKEYYSDRFAGEISHFFTGRVDSSTIEERRL